VCKQKHTHSVYVWYVWGGQRRPIRRQKRKKKKLFGRKNRKGGNNTYKLQSKWNYAIKLQEVVILVRTCAFCVRVDINGTLVFTCSQLQVQKLKKKKKRNSRIGKERGGKNGQVKVNEKEKTRFDQRNKIVGGAGGLGDRIGKNQECSGCTCVLTLFHSHFHWRFEGEKKNQFPFLASTDTLSMDLIVKNTSLLLASWEKKKRATPDRLQRKREREKRGSPCVLNLR